MGLLFAAIFGLTELLSGAMEEIQVTFNTAHFVLSQSEVRGASALVAPLRVHAGRLAKVTICTFVDVWGNNSRNPHL